MTHVTDEQLADAADGALEPAVAAHLARCAPCAEQVDALRRTIEAVRGEEVPEPSPSFWNAFAARVDAALDEPADERPRTFVTGRWAMVAAALLIVVVGLQFAASRMEPPFQTTRTSPERVVIDEPVLDPGGSNVEDAWAVVESIAAGWHFDEAREAGVVPRPGAIEHAATELSPEERAELVRLIEDELKRTGA